MTYTQATYQPHTPLIIESNVLTKVRHADTSRKVQEASAVAVGDVRAFAFDHNAINLSCQPFRDMLPSKVD